MKKILLLLLILATFVVSCGNGGKNSNANTEVQKSEKNSKEIIYKNRILKEVI